MLHKLQELRLNDNQLVSLPMDLGHVTSLGFLDMSSNQVMVSCSRPIPDTRPRILTRCATRVPRRCLKLSAGWYR